MFAKKTFTSLKELGQFGTKVFMSKAFEGVNVSGSIIMPGTLKNLSDGCFFKATVNTIDIPSSVTLIQGTCFMDSKIENLIFRSSTPPKLYGYWEFMRAQLGHIYVPDESVELYKAEKWNYGQTLPFVPLSEYQG